ncbi:MAG: 2'-deoxycytidine 5'-triphosphate deaminase [Terriglobales bacterium]
MSHPKHQLFPDLLEPEPETRSAGVLPSQMIRDLIQSGRITADKSVAEEQIQPASLDLRLGDMAHRVQASFLPGRGATVEDRIRDLRMTRLDLTSGTAILEKGCVYIVPLLEQLHLTPRLYAKANPKSTTGRLDIFTRLITDRGTEFERVPRGYKGKLYAEIVPRTFSVVVRAGMRLNQLRFIRGREDFTGDAWINDLDKRETLVYIDEDNPGKALVDRGLTISINLEAMDGQEVVAYRAKKNTPAIDLAKVNHYRPDDFWDIKLEPRGKQLILDPGDFYILASKERVRVPPEAAAEMLPIDPSIGEFRIHYAGFFDPGFGYGASDIKGTRAVLEVRAHEVPFLIEDGQIVGRLAYKRLLSRPDKIYGVEIGSSYQKQSLTLSKQFLRA